MEKSKKKTVILCVIHHRQNPSESRVRQFRLNTESTISSRQTFTCRQDASYVYPTAQNRAVEVILHPAAANYNTVMIREMNIDQITAAAYRLLIH
jgi:hypothetical protein